MAPDATHRDRFTLVAHKQDDQAVAFARAVKAGLSANPKSLPCRYFYDPQGSQLFEEICALPEYYLTRTETEILRENAAEVAAACPLGAKVVELGSGSAAKTRILLDAFLGRQRRLRYMPMDISRGMLEESSRALLAEYPTLEILAVACEYDDGLRHLASLDNPRFDPPLPPLGKGGIGGVEMADSHVSGPSLFMGDSVADHAKLVLWLGSNIGNFDRPDAANFLRRVRDTMTQADRLLVGIDLRKDRRVQEPAYDDSRGVTARFNLNLLARINRDLGGHFDLGAFRHRAIYDAEIGRIEMYLVSQRDQRVAIDRLGIEVPIAAGEMIHTENSYKYSLAEIEQLAAAAGLVTEWQWFDAKRWFSVNLFAPTGKEPAVLAQTQPAHAGRSP